MEILYLDDDARAVKPFENDAHVILGDWCRITAVSNLVDFNFELYESGKIFDRYVLDIGIVKPNEFSDELYEQWLNEIGISKTTYLNNIISVLGWDYYDLVMRKRESTKNRLNRVLLKTGFADLLLKEKGKDCYRPATLLNKGDEFYSEKLKAFLSE